MYHTTYLYVSIDQINSTRSNIGFTEDAVSDGEDLRTDVPEGEEVLRASEFHPPLASTEDYLAVVPTKKPPPRILSSSKHTSL